MRIDVLTLFPGMFAGPLDQSIVARAIERGVVRIELHNIRDYTLDKHRVVDDYPYGGGAGMVLKPEPVFAALDAVTAAAGAAGRRVLLSPQGRRLDQPLVSELAAEPRLVLLCGHYEGFDDRIRSAVDDEVSLGDFVLSGGEPAAWAIIDAVVRLLPGALGSEESLVDESFAGGLLEYPQYTRPPDFRGMAVPGVLLSGHHGEIAAWRRRQRIVRTARRRPDLIAAAELTPEERSLADDIIAGRAPDES